MSMPKVRSVLDRIGEMLTSSLNCTALEAASLQEHHDVVKFLAKRAIDVYAKGVKCAR